MMQTHILVTTAAFFALSCLHMAVAQDMNSTTNASADTSTTNTSTDPTTNTTTTTSTSTTNTSNAPTTNTTTTKTSTNSTSSSTNSTSTTSTSSTNTTTTTTSNTTTTTTLYVGKATAPVENITQQDGTMALQIHVTTASQSHMRLYDTLSLTNAATGYTEGPFTVQSFGSAFIVVTPLPTSQAQLGPTPTIAVLSVGSASLGTAAIGNDPVAFYGNETREFWLPVGVLTPIIQTRHMQLLASTFVGSPQEQWMDRIVITNADGFRFADIQIKKDIARFNRSKAHPRSFETLDVTLGMAQTPLKNFPPDLPGQDKGAFSRMDVSIMTERLNRVFNWLPLGLAQTTIGKARREAVIISSPDARFVIISSPATEYSGDFAYLAVEYAHLDIHILDMRNRASIRGLLPELWGLKKMSNRTKQLTCPPWSSEAPKIGPKGIDADAVRNSQFFQI